MVEGAEEGVEHAGPGDDADDDEGVHAALLEPRVQLRPVEAVEAVLDDEGLPLGGRGTGEGGREAEVRGAGVRAPENIFCPQAAAFRTEIVHENA